MNKPISLNPNDWADLPTPREKTFKELVSFSADLGELVTIENRKCLRVLTRNFRRLADEYNVRKQIFMIRELYTKGLQALWTYPQVDMIRDCYNEIQRKGGCETELALLERWYFDLQRTEGTRWSGRFPKEDKSQGKKLAEILGLDETIIFQLAVMIPLAYYGVVPVKDHNYFVRTLQRFRHELDDRMVLALDLLERCRNKHRKRPRREERLPFNLVLEDE